MTHVATLITRSDTPLPDGVERLAAQHLSNVGNPTWLHPGMAVDIPFTPSGGVSDRTMAASLRRAIALSGTGGDNTIDVVVQQAAGRRKRLLLADMDSTMIGQECIDELADFIGEKARVSAITERAMRGEIEFAPALRERCAILAGLPAAIVDEVIAQRLTLTPGGPALVRTMRRYGAYTCLVSGGFTLFTAKIAAKIGFDENRGNQLIIDDTGRLAGTVASPILGRDAKLQTLKELRNKHGIAHHDTLVVGDGANDLAMIGDAGLGVAFRAKPVVAESADARIDHGDLTALLFAQGYHRDAFVE